MARGRRRKPQSKGARAWELASSVTGFCVVAALLFQNPRDVLFLSALVAATWWWAIRVIREQNAASKSLDELLALSPDAFEEWTAARFRDLGYRAKLTPSQGDHGVDVFVEKMGTVGVVQCKKFSRTVGEPVLRDLLGSMQAHNADRAYLVTTGRLTRQAQEWVKGKPIEVWDGECLSSMPLTMAWAAGSPGLHPMVTASSSTMSKVDASDHDARRCRLCGSVLVMRRNRQTGEPFFGCSQFPHCRYTEPVKSRGPAAV